VAKTPYLSIAEKADYCSYIDGWRGIAILLVVAVHTSQHCGNNGHGSFLFGFSETLLDSGARGVQLFFILSAFTLFNSSYRRFKTDSNPRRNFYLRRAFRILPLWFLVVTAYCLLDGKPFWVGGLSASFLFGFVRFQESLEVVSGGWSLFVEETFYLMLPVIFGKITTLRKASNYTIALMALAVLWSSVPYFRLPIPNTNAFVFLFPANQWCFFGIGIMLYYIIHNAGLRLPSSSSRWRWDLAALCLMPIVMTTYLSAIAVMFAFCIYVSSNEGTLLNRIMNNALLRRFGVYCYSIYLLHFLVLRFADPFLQSLMKQAGIGDAAVELRFLLAFPIVSLISLLVGYCCFNLIEKPSVQFGKTVINRGGAVRNLATEST